MFERYTEKARRALFFARYEASQVGSMTITAELLLLGLMRSDARLMTRLLAGSRSSADDIGRDLLAQIGQHEKIATSVEIPFDQQTKRALQFAAEEADQLGHGHIGTEHLLLGIVRDEASQAATILLNRGLRLWDARDAVTKLVAEDASRSASHPTEGSALIQGINSLLDRLGSIGSDNAEVRSLLDEIRQRVAALERHLREQ